MTKHLVSSSSVKLGAVEIHRSHAFEGVAEISKPLALPIPFWDRKRTMPALEIKFDGTTFNWHKLIINVKARK